MNYISAGTVIVDSVSALGVMIAFYYGLTGLECVWFYRRSLFDSARNLWLRGILPLLGGVMLWGALGYNLWYYWTPARSGEATRWNMSFWPHWQIGGVFIIDMIALFSGVVLMLVYRSIKPAFFRGEVLNADTPTLVPEDFGREVGLFGIDEYAKES
jgi:hypothetical protein